MSRKFGKWANVEEALEHGDMIHRKYVRPVYRAIVAGSLIAAFAWLVVNIIGRVAS